MSETAEAFGYMCRVLRRIAALNLLDCVVKAIPDDDSRSFILVGDLIDAMEADAVEDAVAHRKFREALK